MTVPDDIRTQVRQRAKGRCEYCQIPEQFTLSVHQVDHIITRKHCGSSELGNLAWSCMICNLRKGSDIASIDPETDRLTPLFNPRLQEWRSHFRFDNAEIVPVSNVARVTVNLLGINDPDRLSERELLLRAGVYDEYLTRPRPR
ncbi:MAG: HNH endonuclease signature motif containing protein [Pirellulaceae bacterium]